MSQNSAKQTVAQLMSWLDKPTRTTSTSKPRAKFSKADSYNNTKPYGNKSN